MRRERPKELAAAIRAHPAILSTPPVASRSDYLPGGRGSASSTRFSPISARERLLEHAAISTSPRPARPNMARRSSGWPPCRPRATRSARARRARRCGSPRSPACVADAQPRRRRLRILSRPSRCWPWRGEVYGMVLPHFRRSRAARRPLPRGCATNPITCTFVLPRWGGPFSWPNFSQGKTGPLQQPAAPGRRTPDPGHRRRSPLARPGPADLAGTRPAVLCLRRARPAPCSSRPNRSDLIRTAARGRLLDAAPLVEALSRCALRHSRPLRRARPGHGRDELLAEQRDDLRSAAGIFQFGSGA